ncbi:MAG: hypothetical protein CO189_05170 [candidate division Zixibacteria bacterium CG_4_9_14_3_um_filter_46_8]|nr:MAG: hypothetical protein CO189_05170 [candidate division Zixibacteria bacterium CG_4_9_14_3_um_filter_46_8]
MTRNQFDYLGDSRPLALGLTAGTAINGQIWDLAKVPLGNNQYWIYQDNNAKVICSQDIIQINISKFSAHNNYVQMLDNPKHLYLTKEAFSPGRNGKIAFSCRMKAEIFRGIKEDYRDGFCAFNVLDFKTGVVFDIVSNGYKIWTIYERLLIPGLTTENEAFTKIIEVPKATHPREPLDCTIVFDGEKGIAEFYLNSELIYESDRNPLDIDSLQTGFGIITLHPIENGASVSCRDQGGFGQWGAFRVHQI